MSDASPNSFWSPARAAYLCLIWLATTNCGGSDGVGSSAASTASGTTTVGELPENTSTTGQSGSASASSGSGSGSDSGESDSGGASTESSGDETPDASSGTSSGDSTGLDTATGDSSSTDSGPQLERRVVAFLDDSPAPGIRVMQGGASRMWLTGYDGSVVVSLDPDVQGQLAIVASHPSARAQAVALSLDDPGEVIVRLTTMLSGDNEAYDFAPPGVPGSGKACSHCHQSLAEDWYGSPHRTSASNPVVQDLYAGAVSNIADEQRCESEGGQWWRGLEPGTGEAMHRCYIGVGALPTLNVSCGDTRPCDTNATVLGDCADCHAPGIDGKLGGRGLLEAQGDAYEFGVHCDVCHKVESLDLDAAPGVGGRLVIKRPLEPGNANFPFQPLFFGPYRDVGMAMMGAVARDFYGTAEFCAGCHEHEQSVLVPGEAIDLQRWPGGVLPVQTTYGEWLAGPMNPSAPCISCHMPPDAQVSNSANLERLNVEPGIRGGWIRLPGAVRHHTWIGPRQPQSGMLQNSAAVTVETARVGNRVVADVTVRNTGPGHALPTGESLRSIVLLVRATCGTTEMPAVGGSVVPEFGGWLSRKQSPEDFTIWPGAVVGDVVRTVRRTGEWAEYDGYGAFARDGGFAPSEKGIPVDLAAGMATVIAVAGDRVSFDRPLAAGDVAYRGRPSDDPLSGEMTADFVAGASGYAFARVLADAQGRTMVPHFAATDVVADNRLMPGQSVETRHEWLVTCDLPRVTAQLVYRPHPGWLVREKHWDTKHTTMVEVTK